MNDCGLIIVVTDEEVFNNNKGETDKNDGMITSGCEVNKQNVITSKRGMSYKDSGKD